MEPPTKAKPKKMKRKYSEYSLDSESVSDTSNNDVKMEEVNVDFSGFEIAPEDLNGIKLLLNQLFGNAHIDLNQLTTFLIGEEDIGLVIKESELDTECEAGNLEDVNEEDTVYGITTAFNIKQNINVEAVKQLRDFILHLSKVHATEKTQQFISTIFSDESKSVGFIINERYLNIPFAIAIPSLTRLLNEVESKCEREPLFRCSYYIMICKLYKIPKSKKKRNTDYDVMWSIAEEENFDKVADARFEYSALNERDSGLAGSWTEDDEEVIPYRRVLIISENKFKDAVAELTVSA